MNFRHWLIMASVPFVVACQDSSPPQFLAREGPAPFAELLSEPPGFSYGSTIDLWVYSDSEGSISEVAVTGHADSRTCLAASSTLFTTMLQKLPQEDDEALGQAARS